MQVKMMEKNPSSEEGLNESFSKKKVTFCDESSLLYYATEGTVDSLNDSAIHTIQNADFPSSPETSSNIESSSKVTEALDKYLSDQGLCSLPEAIVILERLPEASVYSNSYNDSECKLPNSVKAHSLDLSCSKKFAEYEMNGKKTRPVSKKNKYALQNSKLSLTHIPDKYKNGVGKKNVSETSSIVESCSQNFDGEASKLKFVNNVRTKSNTFSENFPAKPSVFQTKNTDIKQHSILKNSFSKSALSIESEASKYVSKNNTGEKVSCKSVDSIASTYIFSQKNGSKVSFDKYPCIHLEKLNVEQYLASISNFSDSLQNKKDVPMDLELEVGNTTKMLNDLSMSEKIATLNEEPNSKTINLSPSETNKETDEDSLGNISSEEIHPTNYSLNKFFSHNLPEVSPNTDNVVSGHKNSLSNAFISQNENIFKSIDSKHSSPSKNAQISSQKNCSKVSFDKYPCVHLEKLNLKQYLESTSNFSDSLQNKNDVLMDFELEVGNTTKMLSDLSMSEKIATLNEESNSKNINLSPSGANKETDENSSNIIFSEEIHPNYSLNKFFSHNLPEVSPNTDNVLSDHGNIVKSIDSKYSSLSENVQSRIPFVLLKKLSPVKSYQNYITNSPESVCTNLIPTINNVPRIRNVFSISKKKFNKMQKHNKKCPSQFVKHQITENEINIIKPKSIQARSFNVSENSSENSACDEASSDSTSHDSSSEEEDIPLVLLSKQKLINVHSDHYSEPSRGIKVKNSRMCHKHKKKNSVHCNSKHSSTLKRSSSSRISQSVLNDVTRDKMITSLKKKKHKKSLKKKQKKMYKMLMKYLKKEMKSKKHKKKSKRKENRPENSNNCEHGMSVSLNNRRDSESDDSISVIYDSVDKEQSNPTSSKRGSKDEFISTSKKDTKTKKEKKLIDKYRLGFLSNKFSLRFYNKFLASERLLLSKSKMKKNKKKELKRLFSKLKAVGLLNYK